MFDRRRPDVSQGVFETLLVLDGHPIDLDAHLARLRATLSALYPDRPHPPLDVPVERGLYRHRSTGTSGGALRITVAPAASAALEARVEWRETPRSGTASLASVTVPGGLGAHKWADRSLLDEAQARMAADAVPLIVDADGAVLEGGRANVFAVRDGALFTPPLDGRILPGITRAGVIELAASATIPVRERRVSRSDLLAADEVFLTGSVRGIEPAGSLDGTALGDAHEVSEGLAAELRRHWTGSGIAA